MVSTRVMERMQYNSLDENEKRACNRLSSLHYISYLMHKGCYDDGNAIINFKLKSEMDRDHFQFDIANVSAGFSKEDLIYHVKGNIFKAQGVESILYTVHSSIDDSLHGVYLDNKTLVKENIILNESFRVDGLSKTIMKVDLAIDKYPEQDEIFGIHPKSEIYKLYSKGKVDLVSFCNSVFYQAKENPETKTVADTRFHLTKKLSKKFCSKKKKPKLK